MPQIKPGKAERVENAIADMWDAVEFVQTNPQPAIDWLGCTDNDLAILTISEALRRIDAIDLRVYPAWDKGMQSYITDTRALLAAHEQLLASLPGALESRPLDDG